MLTASLPTYAELMAREDAPAGSSWGVFGAGDELGTVNLLDESTARRAAGLVRRGKVFNLDHELDAFAPPVSPNRRAARHTMLSRHDGNVRDDRLDDFYLQVSSQLDGLRHHRHAVHGFYGGVQDDDITEGTATLGVQHVAQHGVAGRGVLLDVARHLSRSGRPLDLREAEALPTRLLDEVADAQGVRFEPGDILLLHTDWARHAIEHLSEEDKASLSGHRRFCGLEQSRETLAWIWDHHFSVVATDTVAVEVMPSVPKSPFTDNVGGMMHPHLIALLGVHLGELWKLDELAEDCDEDGIYEFMVTAKPLNLRGGVGSPPNALAIK